ncbi:MAG: O-methyltransferase [Clostridia bacterium]|nr:O-methyltransferase [Clostridia bacterium]
MNTENAESYIARLYSGKTSLNQALYRAATDLKTYGPVIDDDVARLLRVLIWLTRPMRILEIGTSIGYSTACIAQTVAEWGGTVTTIEQDEKASLQARANFERAGVAGSIEQILGDARTVLPQLDAFDFIFLDVDKRLYPPLLPECARLLKEEGLLVAEDTLFPVINLDPKWHDLIPPIDEFNRLVAECPEFESTILPVGDGVTVAVRKAQSV